MISSKIPDERQGIILQSQLYDRTHDLVRMLSNETIQGSEGADATVSSVYKRDPLAAMSEVYTDFIAFLNTKRGQLESLKSEALFEASAPKFNSEPTLSKLPDSILAFLILANSNVDSSQRISVLATSTPRDSDSTRDSITDDFLKAVSYGKIYSVLR